jgi:DNA-binding NarL/FixJ family response regulator
MNVYLTERQAAAMRMVAKGIDDETIANELGITQTATRALIARALASLHACNRAHGVTRMYETGYISLVATPTTPTRTPRVEAGIIAGASGRE